MAGERVVGMIQVILIDNQLLYRDALQVIVNETKDLKVVATFESLNQVEKRTPKNTDVALINMHLPNDEAIPITKFLKKEIPDIRIIALIDYPDEELLFEMLLAGSDGFLLKNRHPEQLTEVIQDVLEGGYVISGSIGKTIANMICKNRHIEKEMLRRRLQAEDLHFTSREIDILQLVMHGQTNKEIADGLELKGGTVKNYISEIYQKLNIKSRERVIEYLKTLMT